MIDKQDFYHGVAIVRLLESEHCQRVRRHDVGYTVNDETLIFLKYSTKLRSPWRFSFSRDDSERLNSLAGSFRKIVIALVCGGDGICAIAWREAAELLGDDAGWISARRNFNEQYGVAGPRGKLKNKVSLRQWPSIVFEDRP
jgi:hypothetical protein